MAGAGAVMGKKKHRREEKIAMGGRLAGVTGDVLEEGELIWLELFNAEGRRMNLVLDDGDAHQLVSTVIALAQMAGITEPVPDLPRLVLPLPVERIAIAQGRAPEEVIVTIGVGLMVLSFSIEVAMLNELGEHVRGAPKPSGGRRVH